MCISSGDAQRRLPIGIAAIEYTAIAYYTAIHSQGFMKKISEYCVRMTNTLDDEFKIF